MNVDPPLCASELVLTVLAENVAPGRAHRPYRALDPYITRLICEDLNDSRTRGVGFAIRQKYLMSSGLPLA